jgi:hypothetical protein
VTAEVNAAVPQSSQPTEVLTPTVRTTAKRAAFWVLASVFILIVAFVSFTLVGTGSNGVDLGPTNPAPSGAKALVQVLGEHGITVTPASSLTQAKALATDPAHTTLLIYDPDQILNDSQLHEAAVLGNHVVLINPTFGQLKSLAPAVAQAGPVDQTLTADCDLPAVTLAGSVSGASFGYRILTKELTSESTVLTCLQSRKGVFSLVRQQFPRSTVDVVGTPDAFANGSITRDGNAALALNLLGDDSRLIWYLPTVEDAAAAGVPPLSELSPRWVTPTLTLLILTALAAALWRGRRFGPLIVENLPVVVRASETMLGRARLYERSAARLRALDSLRIGAIARLAAVTGLPRTATIDEVIATVSRVAELPLSDVKSALLDARPASDKQLVRLSDDLLTLERAVAAAVRPA